MDFYGVKLFFEITVTGEPDEGSKDEFYNGTDKFYEESVYLVEASSANDAFSRAEALAKKNNESYMNKYGQTVKHTFYDSVECFKLFCDPGDGAEVFSTCFAVEDGQKLEDVLEQRYSSCSAEDMHKLRHS